MMKELINVEYHLNYLFNLTRHRYNMRRIWLRGGSELQRLRLLSLTASPLWLFFCALKTDGAASSFKMLINWIKCRIV